VTAAAQEHEIEDGRSHRAAHQMREPPLLVLDAPHLRVQRKDTAVLHVVEDMIQVLTVEDAISLPGRDDPAAGDLSVGLTVRWGAGRKKPLQYNNQAAASNRSNPSASTCARLPASMKLLRVFHFPPRCLLKNNLTCCGRRVHLGPHSKQEVVS
jgi:hypothetical protein